MQRLQSWSVRLLAGLLGMAAQPALASGPYVVDDAAITPAGTGQIESWVSLNRGDYLVVFAPATALTSLPMVEWTLIADRSRQAGASNSGLSLQSKVQLRAEPQAVDRVGFALAGAVRADAASGRVSNLLAYGAASWLAADGVLLHGNLGWTHDRVANQSDVYAGARAELTVTDNLAAHAEVFAGARSGTGFQAGVRPTILGGAMDLEFIVSHNLGGEKATWATLGVAVRF